MLVNLVEHIGFYVYQRSCYLGSPVINSQVLLVYERMNIRVGVLSTSHCDIDARGVQYISIPSVPPAPMVTNCRDNLQYKVMAFILLL